MEDFSPQPLPNPANFSDSDRDERVEEEPLRFGVRPYMFKLLSTAGSAAEPRGREGERERESRLVPAVCGPARWLITDSIYMMEGRERLGGGIFEKEFYWTQNLYTPLSAG